MIHNFTRYSIRHEIYACTQQLFIHVTSRHLLNLATLQGNFQAARQVTERPLQPQRPGRAGTNKLGFLGDFVNPPVHDDVSDVGRVAPLPHVGRTGLFEIHDRDDRGLYVDLGWQEAEGGAALSPVVLSFIVATAALMSNG